MSFLFGMMLGAAMLGGGSGNPSSAPPMVSGIPAECLAATTYDQYWQCRYPSVWSQRHDFCTNAFIARNDLNAACDYPAIMRFEFTALQALETQLAQKAAVK
jgi:hypothetical protein